MNFKPGNKKLRYSYFPDFNVKFQCSVVDSIPSKAHH